MNVPFRILIILAGITTATLQVAAKPWRGIEPIRSRKADVIRMFNQCNDGVRICSFELENERVAIHFSSPLRTKDTRYTCVRDLPPGTVLRIDVVPKGSLRFNRKDFGQSSFKSFDPSPYRTGNFKAYLDKKSGILINTQEGKIVEIIYFTTFADSTLCQSYYRNPEEFISVETRGMPPLVSLKCPTAASQSKITLTAYTFEDDPELQFIWTVSPGTVVKGQHSDTITIDLTGLSGQTIKVMAEVFHKSGLAATATCEVRIHNSRSSPPEEYAFLQLHEFACASMMMRRMKAVELSGSRTILRAPTRQTGFTRSK